MKLEPLFIFLILLLGLILSSFLGGSKYEGFDISSNSLNTSNKNIKGGLGNSTQSSVNYDNYNHYNQSYSNLTNGTTFYDNNHNTAVVNTNNDGVQSLIITLPDSTTPITFTENKSINITKESYVNINDVNAKIFYAPNGATASVITDNNGQAAIKVTTQNGTYYYYVSGTNTNNEITNTQYYGSTGYSVNPSINTLSYQGPNGGSIGKISGPLGNTAYYAQGPNGNSIISNTPPQLITPNINYDYYNSLPPGIPRSLIPPGKEDLYILKSEIVPPVCPICPVLPATQRTEPCPPCPPCARCPEPAFDCKKVPNYSAINNEYLPTPVLNDFSQFGM